MVNQLVTITAGNAVPTTASMDKDQKALFDKALADGKNDIYDKLNTERPDVLAAALTKN